MYSDSRGLPRSFLSKIAPELNAGKLAMLDALQAEWSRTLPLAFNWYWQPFLRGGLFPWKPARSGSQSTFPATRLVTSQKDLMAVAIEGQAKSWSSNLKNRITCALMRDAVLAEDTALRRQLLWINSMKAWLLPYPRQVDLLASAPAKAGALTELSVQASRIMRKLVRAYIAQHRLPDPHQLPLQVNQLSAVLAPSTESSVGWASAWLRMATLERGRRIELPVMDNAYARERGGVRATTFSLVQHKDTEDHGWYLLGTQYVTEKHWDAEDSARTEVLGIDLGLRNLLSTSEGDVFGQGFLNVLRQYDDKLLRLQKGLQGAGQKRLSQCKRYRLFVQRLRGWLKTTIQTHLGRLLQMRKPRKVVIEDLWFMGPDSGLSRRMNRLLRRFGQRYFLQTLEEKSQEWGFVLEHVEPAYTSQTCHRCGFVHRSNRKGDEFKCQACGHQAHADVNAAKNIARRSSDKAASAPGGYRAQWALSLLKWMARMRAAIEADTSALLRGSRAVGCARAGLRALLHHKDSASRLSHHAREQFTAALGSKNIEGLLNGLRMDLASLLKPASTR